MLFRFIYCLLKNRTFLSVPRIADAKRKPMQASELFPRESEVKEAEKLMKRLILARERCALV